MPGFYVPSYVRDKHVGGYVHIEDPDGPDIEYNTLQCCHCNGHFEVIPGGIEGISNFCPNCYAPHCGQPPCWTCVPFEAKLEAMEGSRRFWKDIEIIGGLR